MPFFYLFKMYIVSVVLVHQKNTETQIILAHIICIYLKNIRHERSLQNWFQQNGFINCFHDNPINSCEKKLINNNNLN